MSSYRTAPDPAETGWPKGVPYIIGNEGCERFSFYGMKSILWTYIAFLSCTETIREHCEAIASKTGYQELPQAQQELLEPALAHGTATVHFFIVGVYAFPMIGAIIADRLLGKYRTILWLSIVYCAGHATLALFEGSLPGIYFGLFLIAVGSGGIKPCVSAHVGDQFGRGNWSKLQRVFQIFYFIINFGSFFATVLIPITKEAFGWSVAFAIPGILMGIATVAFWMGRKVFVHVPPKPGGFLGLLDALSSTFLVLTFLIPLLKVELEDLSWWAIAILSPASFAVGLALFAWRQRLSPDDGFLAVLFYALKVRFGGREERPLVSAVDAAEVDGEGGEHPATAEAVGPDEALIAAGPEAAKTMTHGTADGAEEPELRKSPFWAPAVRRFGLEQAEGPMAVLRIMSIFVLVSVFWALFDQHASSWIQQAMMMDRTIPLPWGGEVSLLKEQIQAANPLLVMALIPLTGLVVYPAFEKLGIRMTPLRRMTMGMLLASTAFVAVALVQRAIDAGRETGEEVHVAWQLVGYVLITLAEVMVSITGLEFAYSQAPRRMKSTIMGFWLLTVSLGNVIVVLLSVFGGLALEDFFWTFAALMAGAALLFGLRASFYKYKDYPQ